jgi:two-component system, LytTR family, response regulator
MLIKAVIVDDEKANRINLRSLISKYSSDVEIVAEASDVSEGYTIISAEMPHLVFLDIRMPEGTAFDLLDRFERIEFEVIFITAYDEYALRAFRFNALDYILKPIKIDELINGITRARIRISQKLPSSSILNYLSNQNLEDLDKKIALQQEDQTQFISLKSIIRCEADSNYTIFYLESNRRVIVSKTLKEYTETLEPLGFIRVHQSHLVNLHHIEVYKKNDGGYIETTDGEQVPISRARKKYVIEILTKP